MAKQTIDLGTLGGADGTGDSIRTAGAKINSNFTELYADPLAQTQIGLLGNDISTLQTNADLVFKPSGTGSIIFPGITIDDNAIRTNRTDDDLVIRPNGSGSVVIHAISFSGTSIRSQDSSNVNINENLNVDGALSANDTLTVSGATSSQSTLDVTGNTSLASLTVSGASSFVGTTTIDNLTFNDNIISSSSNADLLLTPGGTGVVRVSNLTIDSNINLTDNVIRATNSDSDLVISASGSGLVRITNINIDQGTIDGTIIGGTVPVAGTFSSLALHDPNTGTVSTPGITISDNEIATSRSNENLIVEGNGTGTVKLNGFQLPVSDGFTGQLLSTDGAKTTTFENTPPFVVFNTDVQDGTATVFGTSLGQVIDSWSASTYRSVKYHIQISDATADRYRLIDANVTHDGVTAYISVFGGVDNGDGDGSSVYDSIDFTADISGGNVRLLGTVNNTNNQVIKLVRRVIKV